MFCFISSQLCRLTSSSSQRSRCPSQLASASCMADMTSFQARDPLISVHTNPFRTFGNTWLRRFRLITSPSTNLFTSEGNKRCSFFYGHLIITCITAVAFKGQKPALANLDMIFETETPCVTPRFMKFHTPIALNAAFLEPSAAEGQGPCKFVHLKSFSSNKTLLSLEAVARRSPVLAGQQWRCSFAWKAAHQCMSSVHVSHHERGQSILSPAHGDESEVQIISSTLQTSASESLPPLFACTLTTASAHTLILLSMTLNRKVKALMSAGACGQQGDKSVPKLCYNH